MQGMFKVGDMAVYPAQGVAEILGIESKSIAGNEEIFYVLRVLNTERRIMIPLNKVADVGLRPIIDDDQVEEVYGVLRQRDVELDNQTWNRRYRKYVEKIRTGSVIDVAEVLRDLYLLKLDKTLSFGERKMLDTARGLLVKELSIAQAIDEESISTELEEMFAGPEPAPDGAEG
ncbi:MAG: CarD family transcriptional regulator [Myxococcales bacterium]|nr:CarD family transcriptional regulator [Myxococcales bacterium]